MNGALRNICVNCTQYEHSDLKQIFDDSWNLGNFVSLLLLVDGFVCKLPSILTVVSDQR